jgi:FtsH-binding integral membrane protein
MPIDLNSVRSPSTVAAARPDAGLAGYMRGVYNYMAGGLALTGGVAWFGYTSGLFAQIAHTPLVYLVLFAPLVLVMVLGFRIQRMSLAAAQATYWVYAALMGLSLSWIFMAYTGQSLAEVFFITGGTFGAMSVYGYTTRTDLTRLGSFLMMGLIGIIVASLVNFFLHSSAVQFAVSVMGVLIFTGLTAYDTQKIKALYYATGGTGEMAGKATVMGALSLYLDFINLFLMLLRLFGNRR